MSEESTPYVPAPSPVVGVAEPHRAVNGWAPGSYFGKCINCQGEFMGDKRAHACPKCAYHQPLLDLEARAAALTTQLAEAEAAKAKLGEKIEEHKDYFNGRIHNLLVMVKDEKALTEKAEARADKAATRLREEEAKRIEQVQEVLRSWRDSGGPSVPEHKHELFLAAFASYQQFFNLLAIELTGQSLPEEAELPPLPSLAPQPVGEEGGQGA